MRTFFSIALLGLALISGIQASEKLYSWDFVQGTLQTTNGGTPASFTLAQPQAGDVFKLFYTDQSGNEIKSFEIIFPNIDPTKVINGQYGGDITHPQVFVGNLGGNTRLEFNKDATNSSVTIGLVGDATKGPNVNIGQTGIQIDNIPNATFGNISINTPIVGDVAFASNCYIEGDLSVGANGESAGNVPSGTSVGGTVRLGGVVLGSAHIHGGVDGFLDVDHVGQYVELGAVGDYAQISSVNSNLNVEQNVGGKLNINTVQNLNISTISGNASVNQISGTLTIEGNNASVGKIDNRGGVISEINNSGTLTHLSNLGTISRYEDTSNASIDIMKINANVNNVTVNSRPGELNLNNGCENLVINGQGVGILMGNAPIGEYNNNALVTAFNNLGTISAINNSTVISSLTNNGVVQSIANGDDSHTAMIGSLLNQRAGFIGTLNNKNGIIANSNVRPTGYVGQPA